jgi:hypothetical protein
MSMHATAGFEVQEWNEKPLDEQEGLPKITRASVRQTLTGDIEGESVVEYVMAYAEDGSAQFTHVERVRGRVGGRAGTYVVLGTGTYDPKRRLARGAWKIVPGSGTGELRGLRGQGGFSAEHGPKGEVSMDYEL